MTVVFRKCAGKPLTFVIDAPANPGHIAQMVVRDGKRVLVQKSQNFYLHHTEKYSKEDSEILYNSLKKAMPNTNIKLRQKVSWLTRGC